MKSKIVLFLVALLVWALLSWVPDWQELLVGIFVAGLVVAVSGDLFIARPHILRRPLRYWYFFIYYLPHLLIECVKANIDVARRVLHPRLPINPGIVKVKTSLKSDIALTLLANSITLTPGTLTVDIDRENSVLYVHWIDVQAQDVEGATKIVVERFEELLRKIFD